MRALVETTAGAGHLGPLVPFARALRDAGHDVLVAAPASFAAAGFGTTLLGLASGIPMVVVPLFADQPYNAARVAEIGAGIALEGGPPAVGDLAQSRQRVLSEESFRTAARAVAEEIGRLPPVSSSVHPARGGGGHRHPGARP